MRQARTTHGDFHRESSGPLSNQKTPWQGSQRPGMAWGLLGALMSALLGMGGVAQAQSVPDGCLPDARVMRLLNLSCASALPAAPPGFTLERLHDCSTIASLVNLGGANPIPLQTLLESAVVVRKQCVSAPCALSYGDMGILSAAGLYEDALICGVVGMGASKTQAPESTTFQSTTLPSTTSGAAVEATSPNSLLSTKPVTLKAEVTPLGAYAQQSGAAVVVPTLASLALQPDGGLRVAVLDSGIERDSVPSLSVLDDGWQDPWLPNANQETHLEDGLGHGTSVASLIDSTSGGLAELVSVKILDATGRGTLVGLSRGVLMAAGPLQARLLNLSLAWSIPGAPHQDMPYYVQEALGAAYLHGARVIAAAGNRSNIADPDALWFYPAAAAKVQDELPLHVLSVSGLNADDQVSTQAVGLGNEGDPIDLWAPSEHICVATSQRAIPQGVQRLSGTSFAAPQVTGAMVLFLSALGLAQDSQAASQSAGGWVDLLVPALQIEPNHHLNLCSSAEALGFVIPDCLNLAAQATLDPDDCDLSMGAQVPVPDPGTWVRGIEYPLYPSSTGQIIDGQVVLPVDQGVDAAWVDGLSSAPSRPVCTSCEYCPTFAELDVGFAATEFGHHQVRLTVNGGYVYIAVPELSNFLAQQSLQSSPLTTYPVMTSYWLSALLGMTGATDPWIVAQELSTGAWSGQPLRTGC